jgi:hypothetical protein
MSLTMHVTHPLTACVTLCTTPHPHGLHPPLHPPQEKIEVNGAGTSAVYQYLKSSCAACDGDVTWNFYAKFLVDRSGNVVERRNEASAADSEAKIKELLAQSA